MPQQFAVSLRCRPTKTNRISLQGHHVLTGLPGGPTTGADTTVHQLLAVAATEYDAYFE